MSKNFLLTGGTGLVGRQLTPMLQQAGHTVSWLTRNANRAAPEGVQLYEWNVDAGAIDAAALAQCHCLVHLAGANVGEKRWTAARKAEILNSRVQSTRLLAQQIQATGHKPEAVLGASAIGIYGMHDNNVLFTEESPHGNDFLAQVTQQWEAESAAFGQMGIRTVNLRIGVVAAIGGGALEAIAKPVRMGAGAPLGNGKQVMSWVHIDDVCRAILFAYEHPTMSGPYNVVAPNPVTNAEFTKAVAKVLRKPMFLPNVPGFVLKTMLGEMAQIALLGSNVSSQKLQAAGFEHQYPTLQPALQQLLA